MDVNAVLNQIKLFHLVTIVGGDVFIETLTILYSGEKPIEENLVKVAEIKSNGFNFDEKTFLEKLKLGDNVIKHMDISLSYKLIQCTCELKPRQCSLNNSCVWSKRCHKEKQDCLEHLLYKFKMERNFLAHQLSSLGLISDDVFIRRKIQNMEHLFAIVEKVGEKAQLSTDEIKSWKDRIELDSNTFCDQVGIINPAPPRSPPILPPRSPPILPPHYLLLSSRQRHSSPHPPLLNVPSLRLTLHSFPPLPPLNPFLDHLHVSYFDQSLEEIPIKGKLTEENIHYDNLSKGDSVIKLQPCSYYPLKVPLINAFAETDLIHTWKNPSEKSNRFYWVSRLIRTQALHNSEENKSFWKEYEEYLED